MSEEDIKKGSRWNSELSTELAREGFGIIFVTPDNMEKPWLMFEAGALSKSLDDRVTPLLFDVSKSDIGQNPLGIFQASDFKYDDMKRLIDSINNSLDSPIDKEFWEKSFEAFWPSFLSECEQIVAHTTTSKPETVSKTLNESEKIALIADTVVGLKRDVLNIEANQSELLKRSKTELFDDDVMIAKQTISEAQNIISVISELDIELVKLKSASNNPSEIASVLKLLGAISEVRSSTHRLFDGVFALSRGVLGPNITL